MLKKQLQHRKIILASGSPRRQQFFRDMDLDFEIRIKEVKEVYPVSLQQEQITEFLCRLKSAAFDGTLAEQDILITSDTIVWHGGKALGKPTGYDEAFSMLRSLSGTTHQVITSVCFTTTLKSDMVTEVTEVTFKQLSDDEIRYYLENYAPYDKAGSYGIQEWLGFIAVTSIKGSYANVMGMPVDRVYDYLSKLN